MYDIIIIGGGPAGVSAGIYAASRGKKTLLIEKKRIGGIIGNVSTVTHYTAIMQPETGESFATRMWNQIKNCGVEIINEEVVSTSLKGDVKSVTTDKNTYSAKKVIIAAGSTPRKLDIEGEKPLDGKYIYLNAANDGRGLRDCAGSACTDTCAGRDWACPEICQLEWGCTRDSKDGSGDKWAMAGVEGCALAAHCRHGWYG